MKAFIFPGQASQFEGMGKDLYESSEEAKELFNQANEILGFNISDIMFNGSAEDLKATKVTQPAVFLHSIIKLKTTPDIGKPEAVAGHSLGEFSALVAAGALSFEDALKLVSVRALEMQKACEQESSTMAAIVGLEDAIVEKACNEIDEIVVAANYNCPGQLVISGSDKGIDLAVAKLTELGARRALKLQVGGAFHSPLMKPAEEGLQKAIEDTSFKNTLCPIYQNVDAQASTDAEQIKSKLVRQLTSPVKWTQTIQNMNTDGVSEFIEVGGTGKVLRGMIKRISRDIETSTM